jgi:putative endonuclease
MDLARFIARLFGPSLTAPVVLTRSRNSAAGKPERLGRREIGDCGERLAAAWLRRRNCRVLWRNYRPRGGGEVDLIYREDDVLVFCEVKTRTREDFGAPSEAVTPEKQALIIRGALDWLKKLDFPDIRFRFDVMEVILEEGEPPRLNRIDSAFTLPDAYHL